VELTVKMMYDTSNTTCSVQPLVGRMVVLETLSSRPASSLKTAFSSGLFSVVVELNYSNKVTSHVVVLLPLTFTMTPLSRCLLWGTEKVLKNYLVSHGVLQKGLKNHLNPPFLYRLGGLKNSTTIKQEPFPLFYSARGPRESGKKK
jgi:hypothetical protein